jgi:hypothetical protein
MREKECRMNGTEYAKMQLQDTLGLLNVIVGDVNEDQYNWIPEGTTCNSVAKSHVHVLSSIDFFVNMIVGGGRSKWPEAAEKLGLPANPTKIWQADGRVALEPMKEYGKYVQETALAAVSKLSDADLDREIESQFGKHPAGWYLQLSGMHTAGHAGDMAAIKGMQGLKGLPF